MILQLQINRLLQAMPYKYSRTVQETLWDVFEFKTQCRNELRANNPLVHVICWWRAPATHIAYCTFNGATFGTLAIVYFLETSVSNRIPFFHHWANMIKTNFFANLKLNFNLSYVWRNFYYTRWMSLLFWISCVPKQFAILNWVSLILSQGFSISALLTFWAKNSFIFFFFWVMSPCALQDI